MSSTTARPEVLVSNTARIGNPDTTTVGQPGPLGRARVVFALPTNGTGPVNLAKPEVVVGVPLGYVGAPTDGTVVGSSAAVWVHRLVSAAKTQDTRRLG